MTIQRGENILCVAAIDAISISIKHERVDKVRPWIDSLLIVAVAALADDLITLFRSGHSHGLLLRITWT